MPCSTNTKQTYPTLLLQQIARNTCAIASSQAGDVNSVAGTANEIAASPNTGAVVLSLPIALTFTGKTVTGGTFTGNTFTNPTFSSPLSVANGGTGAASLTATAVLLGNATSPIAASNMTYVTPVLTVPASFAITGAGSLAFNAGGANQNITLTPSGTGYVAAVARSFAVGETFSPLAWGSGGAIDVNGSSGGLVALYYGGVARGYFLALNAGGFSFNTQGVGTFDFVVNGSQRGQFSSMGLDIVGRINYISQSSSVTSTATAAATTTLTATSTVVQIFTGATTQTVQLPAANVLGANVGLWYVVKNRSSGVVTVQRAGADLIDGATTIALATNDSVTLISNGSAEWTVN